MTLYRHIVKKTGIILIFVSCIIPVSAQYSLGMTGLLNTPDANMQQDGHFMAGANFLPEEMLPENWGYNSGNYFLNMTFFPFVEAAYRCTLFKGEFKAGNKWQQDRSVSLRLRPLKEGRFYPSVVVGSNDLLTTRELNILNKKKGNRFFYSAYATATKNLDLNNNIFSLTFGSYLFSKNSTYNGVFGGVKYSPSFLRQASLIAEYDSNNINTGLTVKLFNHLSLYAFSYDFKAVSCGLRYEICLLN